MNIILKNKNKQKYFLCNINVGKDSAIFSWSDNKIPKYAFRNDKTLKVFSRKCAEKDKVKICESAFENCRELKAVVFRKKKLKAKDKTIHIKKKPKIKSLSIQYHAFKDCDNLHTVVFPPFSSLSIEKEAFANCKNLRSFVLIEDVVSAGSAITISEEAFSNCNDITFICKKDGKVARFARENNFKVVSIDE